MDQKYKLAVPGYPVQAPANCNSGEFYLEHVKEIVRWYTGLTFTGQLPLIKLDDASTDDHSLQNFLVVVPEGELSADKEEVLKFAELSRNYELLVQGGLELGGL